MDLNDHLITAANHPDGLLPPVVTDDEARMLSAKGVVAAGPKGWALTENGRLVARAVYEDRLTSRS